MGTVTLVVALICVYSLEGFNIFLLKKVLTSAYCFFLLNRNFVEHLNFVSSLKFIQFNRANRNF